MKFSLPLTLLTLVGFTACLPPVLAQTPAMGVPLQGQEGYLLGGGDRVRLDIFNVPEYSGEYQVLADGTLNLPLAGPVAVQGLTVRQAERAIGQKFADILTRPVVTVSLLSSRPFQVAIAGEVNRPGSYTAPPVAQAGVPTLTKMIQLAGGFTPSANLHQVQIQRRQPGNTGAVERINVDLWRLLRSGDITQDIALRDGDSVLIPATASINLDETNQLANTNFAATTENRPIKIAVVGEVNRPGPHTITADVPGTNQPGSSLSGENQPGINNKVSIPTVTRAIQIAGGITQSADIRKIQVKRITRTGTEQTATVDFWKLLQGGDLRQDLPLQDGDTIVVPTATALTASETTAMAAASFSPDTITVNVVGEVSKPGAVQVPPNTPLNQAILAAGGFNTRARRGSVDFIRLNPNGTVARRKISINLAQGLNEQNNPPLRNNDTIVVGRSGLASFSDTVGTILSPVTGFFSLFRILGF